MAKQRQQEPMQVLIPKVYDPTFFAKLASYGIVPRTVQEKQAILDATARLKMQANAMFNEAKPDMAVKTAAFAMIQADPEVKNAAFNYAVVQK